MTLDGTNSPSGPPRFRLLVMADLCGDGAPACPGPQPIDKVSFRESFRACAPRVRLKSDCVPSGSTSQSVDLTFESLADFEPMALLSRADSTSSLLATFQALVAVASGETSVESALAELQSHDPPQTILETLKSELRANPAPTSDSGSPSTDAPGDLLASVGMPDVAAAPGKTTIEGLIDALGIPRKAIADKPQRETAAKLATQVCRSLHAHLDAVLHNPSLQSLEATWRGIQFLVSKTDFQNAPIGIDAFHCRREDLVESLRSAFCGDAHVPDSLAADVVLLDFEFGQNRRDIDTLRELGEIAEEGYSTILTGASPDLVSSNGGFSQPPQSFAQRFDEPDLIDWRAFRKSPVASAVAMTMPRVAGRLNYGPKTIPVPNLAYEEANGTLWGRGIWAVGAAMVQSVARTGWALSISGSQHGRVDDVPVVPVDIRSRIVHQTLDAAWTDEQLTELARAGFVVLSARPGQNAAIVMSAPTLFDPETTADAAETREARMHASLPFRLFANRVARRLSTIQPWLTPAMTDEQIRNELVNSVGSLFDARGCVEVEVLRSSEATADRIVGVRVVPNFRILGHDPELNVTFELRQ